MFSILDVILVLVMFLSGVLAMIRGFTREVLSIASWLASAIAVLLMLKYFPETSAILEKFIGHKVAAQAIFSLILATIVLVFVHLFTIWVSDRVLSSSMGALDHTLGFIFGLGRGLVLIVVLYLLFANLVTKQTHDSWVQNSRSLPLVQGTGEMIISLLPEDLAKDITEKFKKTTYNEQPSGEGSPNRRRNAKKDVNRGYPGNELRGMDQLVESTGSVTQN
ncbi:MAG: CvpA family protein [Methyloligellaceae bacterium]